MPIYEFKCTECGHVTERLLRVDARRPRKCEQCSGKLEKLISRTSFQLKGGGWYDHGYTKKSGGSSSSTSDKSSSTSDKSSSTSDKSSSTSAKSSDSSKSGSGSSSEGKGGKKACAAG